MLQKECGSLLLQGNHNSVFKMKKQISFLQQGCYCFGENTPFARLISALGFISRGQNPLILQTSSIRAKLATGELAKMGSAKLFRGACQLSKMSETFRQHCCC